MKFLAALALVAALAAPASAQTFSFQTGGYFVGAPGNIALNVEEPPVAQGTIQALGLSFNPASGNYEGTGHVQLTINGALIDDPSAAVTVVPGPVAGQPTCDNVRVQYVAGIVVAGQSAAGPYALASGVERFDVGAGCPLEVLVFNGAIGAQAVHALDLNQFSARIRLAARRAVRDLPSFGSLKASFR